MSGVGCDCKLMSSDPANVSAKFKFMWLLCHFFALFPSMICECLPVFCALLTLTSLFSSLP
jgi:hypothetical protein